MSKRTRDKMEESDQIASEQEPVKPSETEKNAISKFCALSLKTKKIQTETKEAVKDIKPEIKKLRSQLLEALKTKSSEILQIKSQNKDVPSFIRLFKNVKEINITPEIVEEAIENLNEDDIKELTEEGDAENAVVKAILANVRRIIRSFNEQPKLTDSLPRGLKASEVQSAEDEISKYAVSLHEKSSNVLKREKQKREILLSLRSEIEKTKQDLEPFFESRNLSSQRVNFENTPFNICYRKTVDRPKITLKLLEVFVTECLQDILKKKSSKSVEKQLMDKKNDFLSNLQTRIATIETKEKSIMHLRGLKK